MVLFKAALVLFAKLPGSHMYAYTVRNVRLSKDSERYNQLFL